MNVPFHRVIGRPPDRLRVCDSWARKITNPNGAWNLFYEERKKDGLCVSGMEGTRGLKNKSPTCHNASQRQKWWGGSTVPREKRELQIPHGKSPNPAARGPRSLEPAGSLRGEGGKGMLRAGKIALAHKTWGQAWLWPCSFRSSLGLTQASAFSCQTPRPTPLPLILFGSFFLLWEAFLIGFFFLGPNAVSFLCSPKHQGCCFNVHSH